MKADKSSFENSSCLPVPLTLSAEDYADDLFNSPGEASEPMQGSVCGDAELTLSSSDERDSILDVLAAFPRPTSHIRQRPNASGS